MSDTTQNHSHPAATAARRDDAGMALITTLLILTLISGLMAGLLAAVMADQRASGVERDQTQAYAAAHAGLEQLTSDLNALFTVNFSPTRNQINTIAARVPNIPNFAFIDPLSGGSGYQITFNPDAAGDPAPTCPNGCPITAGPFTGFRGIMTPYTLTVTARSTGGGSEVRLRRTLQTVSIPVFQFGVFSQTDLTFYAGDPFNFGGLVHTNGNLFLAQAAGQTLTLSDRVTAREVIRRFLSNGVGTNTGTWTGTVRIAKGGGQFANLLFNQGSVTGGPYTPVNEPPAMSPGWTTISRTTFNSYIRSRTTGFNALQLPLVQAGAEPIDLIRRPRINSDEDTNNSVVFGQRYFAQASIRILLSDTAGDILNLPTVTPDPPVELGFLSGALPNPYPAGFEHSIAGALRPLPPFAASGAAGVPTGAAPGLVPANSYLSQNPNEPLLGGVLKIEIQRNNGTWLDVTQEILRFGFTGRNLSNGTLHTPSVSTTPLTFCPELYANSIVRIQRVRDRPIDFATYGLCGVAGLAGGVPGQTIPGAFPAGVNVSPDPRDYWPNTLFDAREGNIRDVGNGTLNMSLNGIIHYIELDVNNLRRWLAGAIPGNGGQVMNNNGNGYILYFSDRRGNRNQFNEETGEYGNEDNINPNTAAGTFNNTLDVGPPVPAAFMAQEPPPPSNVMWLGEDANGNGQLDDYGERARNHYAGGNVGIYVGAAQHPFTTQHVPANAADRPRAVAAARINRPLFFRRALKLVNGGIVGGVNSLPALGFTVASENPVYVQGNYNATATIPANDPNVPAAIVADAVTLLSNSWNDLRSFTSPNDTAPSALPAPYNSGRRVNAGQDTGYRFAVAAGKTGAFTRAGWATDTAQIWGTDGGVGNFLRLLEDWQTNNPWIRYNGSIINLYLSRQATGAFKCCQTVYNFGNRDFRFDTAFLLPANLPPGTPMFRDVNSLTFRQLLRPTEP